MSGKVLLVTQHVVLHPEQEDHAPYDADNEDKGITAPQLRSPASFCCLRLGSLVSCPEIPIPLN